jgi:hypothetical protein
VELMLKKLKSFSYAFWFAFPLTFFIYIGHALKRSHGHLRLKHLVLLSLGTLLIYIWHQFKSKDFILKKKALLIASVIFLIFNMINSELIYSHEGIILNLLRGSSFLSLILFGAYLLKDKIILLYGVIALSCIIHFLVPFASPDPIIDVWVYAMKGADLLLSGINPYSAYYPDLYNGKYELTNGFCYWPTATFSFTLSRFFFGDVRWILVIANFLSLAGLRLLAWEKHGQSSWLIVLLWATFPVSLFILEQSWVDGLIIPLIIFHIYQLKKGGIKRAAVLLGFMCMTKQYMIFYCILTFFYILKVLGFKKAIIYSVVTIVTALAIASPFLIWDTDLFLQKSVFDLLKLGHREDALSWVSYFSHFYDFYIPGGFTGSLYVIVTLFFSWMTYREGTIKGLLLGLISVYLFVFLFGKQAFCNYYYLIALYLLLYLIEFKEKPLET